MNSKPLLIIGYGNPARGDDGLAPAFVDRVQQMELSRADVRSEYQLCVEYALELADYRRVLFVDASIDASPPFEYSLLTDHAPKHMDTHTLTPGAVMYLAKTLFGAQTEAALLAIRGYRFDPFSEQLSDPAQENLERSLAFFVSRYGRHLHKRS